MARALSSPLCPPSPSSLSPLSFSPAGASNSAVAVAEAVQHFITAMDSLKLNMVAADQVYPPLADLLAALNRIPALPADFSGKVKARAWAARVHAMPASAELGEGDVRQLLFDLESAYNAFMLVLQ